MNEIFVFGSNREGRHGKGAALHARMNYGAIYGQAKGPQGRSYAIVTKELRRGYPRVTLREVEDQVVEFLSYAASRPHETFIVTKIGCGLAGFKESEIRPLFHNAPPNVRLPEGWG